MKRYTQLRILENIFNYFQFFLFPFFGELTPLFEQNVVATNLLNTKCVAHLPGDLSPAVDRPTSAEHLLAPVPQRLKITFFPNFFNKFSFSKISSPIYPHPLTEHTHIKKSPLAPLVVMETAI